MKACRNLRAGAAKGVLAAAWLGALAAGGHGASAYAASVEQDTLAQISQIRAIKAATDERSIAASNRTMDEAWKYFNAHREAALPVLRRQLDAEIASQAPSQLLLLDLGYYLSQKDDAADRARTRDALLKLDPSAPIMQMNRHEMFMYAHRLAQRQDPQLLPFLDRAFLHGDVSVFIPQHVLTLDGTLVSAYLYGLYGQAGEEHLRALLGDKAVLRRDIETLIWLGSPASVAAVRDAMLANRDYDTFVRGVAFMMKAGGPEGRAALLALDMSGYDARTRAYYARIRPNVEAVNYAALSHQFEGMPGMVSMDEVELKRRLDAMYEAYGKDDSTSPQALLDSTLPRDYLAERLSRIRSRMFYRISDEALDDIEITNALLNALYYRQN